MRTRLSKQDQASVDRFLTLMGTPPDPLLLRCKSCGKLRETTEFSDPILALQPFSCVELGSSCDLGESVRSDAQPTEPHFVPGSFVIVSNDETNYVPGMIDYTPEKHPEFEEYRDSPFKDEKLLQGYYVSLLNSPDQNFASGWFYLHQISPLERIHCNIMPTGEALAKFQMCVSMERSDLRRRLFKFSYMAHTYQLKCTLPPEPPRVPVKHGAYITSGPSTAKELFVNIVPDLSEAGNVEVTRLVAPIAGSSAGVPEGTFYRVNIGHSVGEGTSRAEGGDRPNPPEE